METGSSTGGLKSVAGTYAAQFMRQFGDAAKAAKTNGEKLKQSDFEIAIPGSAAAKTAGPGAPSFEDLGPDHPLSILNDFDANQDGKIGFRETMQMLVEFGKPLNIGQDSGSSGGVLMRDINSIEELEEYLGSIFDGVFSKREADAILAKFDLDGDGRIAGEEREAMVQGLEEEAKRRREIALEKGSAPFVVSTQVEAAEPEGELRDRLRDLRAG